MTDQAAISFANLNVPEEGVIAVVAEEGPKLPPVAKDLDKTSKGLVSRGVEISGFKGKKETTVDLLAPSGLNVSRLVVVGAGKTAEYGSEDWLNLGGAVRGLLTGKEGPTAHIVVEGAGREIAPADVANFALGVVLRGYKFRKYKSKPAKKNGAAEREQRQDAQKNRRALRRPEGRDQVVRVGQGHGRRRDARARSRQRAGQCARTRGVCDARQGARQGRRSGRGADSRRTQEAWHECAACRGAGERLGRAMWW